MIQEIKIKNFYSFKDETVFSFEATDDTSLDARHVVQVAPGVRLLRFAIVYGANASGKSNLLQVLEFLRRFWFRSKESMDEETGVIPFLLDQYIPMQPSEFSLTFYANGKKFLYELSLTSKRVIEESLSVYETAEPKRLFWRNMSEGQSVVNLNETEFKVSQAVVDELNTKCLPNMSFFAARRKVNCSLPLIDEVSDWLSISIFPLIHPKSDMFDFTSRQVLADYELKKYLVDFARMADYNIEDLAVKVEELWTEAWAVPTKNENNKAEAQKKTADDSSIFDMNFVQSVKNSRGRELYRMPHQLQSTGTMRTIGLEAALFAAVRHNALLQVDEIETSLHPELVEAIIEKFLTEDSESQLLVTTHYDQLLSKVDVLIRRDEVWFTEKKEDGATELYSLVEFKGLDEVSSFQKSYRNGVFGAIPDINVM